MTKTRPLTPTPQPASTPGPAPAAPHPTLPDYYAEAGQRAGFVRRLFDDTAPQYDRINRVFSLGTGAWYRRQCLRRAGLRPGMRVLDVAVGTGLVAREAARVTGAANGASNGSPNDHPGTVIGLDPSAAMLAEARRGLSLPLIQGRAEALPLPDASMDFLSMGYALRHVADLSVAFAEFHRVLRPGGTVLLLEISRPAGRGAHAAAKFYLGQVVPALCRLTAPRGRAGTLMRYYRDTIEACVPPATILHHLGASGFGEVRCETSLGIFNSYSARRLATG